MILMKEGILKQGVSPLLPRVFFLVYHTLKLPAYFSSGTASKCLPESRSFGIISLRAYHPPSGVIVYYLWSRRMTILNEAISS